jgi:hypothetical protein
VAEARVQRAARARAAAAALALAAALCACGSSDTSNPVPAEPVAAPAPAAPRPPSALDALRGYVGSYPRDVGLFAQPSLQPRLRALLGDRLPVFVENMGVQGPFSEQGGLLYVTGNKPHSGGDEAAALVIDPKTDAVFVWLLHGGKVEEYPEPGKRPSALPADVETTLDNWMDTPLLEEQPEG